MQSMTSSTSRIVRRAPKQHVRCSILALNRAKIAVSARNRFAILLYSTLRAVMDTTRVSLLMRIKDVRNTRAWSDFDAIYRPMLRRFASAQGLDEGDAEDVVQHCMAAVHKHIEQFDYDPDKGRFRGWLRTLVNNHVRNLLKKRRDPIAETQELEQLQDREPLPEVAFDRLWMDEHLKHCLRMVRTEVDENVFVVFQHYVLDEWPVEQVCQAMRMDRNQVYKIKWRITQKLQEKLRRLLDGEESNS